MGIIASNNPNPESPDPTPTKLDKGGYDGTAETLDTKIDAVLEEALLKIDSKLADVTYMGTAEPGDTPTGTGNRYWTAVTPGTYTNFGGVVVTANSLAIISVTAVGVWSVSQTAFNLTTYLKIVDGNKINFWAAEAYPIGTQRNHLGKDWYLPTSAALSTDVPGTSSKWVERLSWYSNLITTLDNSFEKKYTDIFRQLPTTYGYTALSGSIGGDGTDVNWLHTDYKRVKIGSIISYTDTSTPTNVLQVAFYDINKVFVSGIIGGANGTYTVPSGAIYYVRFCANAANSVFAFVSATLYDTLNQSFVLKVNVSDIINNLNSTETTKPVAANQLRIVNEKVESLISTASLLPAKNYNYDINHFILYGQSLSQGDWTDVVVSNVQKYNSLMFTGGIRTWEYSDYANRYNALVPAIERSIDYKEKDKITITNGAASSGNITFTLNGVAFNLAVVSGDTIAQIIGKINAAYASFTGWYTIEYTSTSMVFWKQATGVCSTPIFSGGTTGVTGTFTRTAEGRVPVGAPLRGETPANGIAQNIMGLIQSEDGFLPTDQQYQILVSAPGMGGTGIVDLSNKAGIYYQRLIADVTNGKALALASGKNYWCPAITWIQGEADTYGNMSQTTYYNNMVSLFNNLNTDIKAITGQSEDVQFFLYQTQAFDWYYGGKFTYPDVSLAQLQIANNLSNVHLATPIYHLPLIANDCHFTAIGSKWFGGYFGIAYKRVIVDKKPFSSIKLISQSVVGNNIYLKFEAPVYPLKFDTTSVVDRGVSKGFQIREVADRAQNSFLNIITNVEINKYNVVKITCSSSPVGKKLTYAINGTGLSNQSSGNLRDSQGLKFLFKNVSTDSAETSHDMYNWCPLFETLL